LSPAPPASLTPYRALWCAYFASIGLFNPYAPLWFQHLGFSTLAIGAIASLQAWTRVFAPYGWAWLGDHWEQGARRSTLLRVAAALVLAAALSLLVTRSYAWVALAVVCLFMANGAIVPMAEASLAQRLATANGLDVARYGRVRMWGSLGFIASVSVFGLGLQWAGIEAMPLFNVLVCAGLALAPWALPHRGTRSAPQAGAAPTGVMTVLGRPPVHWFFASVFLTVLAHSSLYAFFSLYLVELGYSKGAVGMLWAVAVAIEVLFFWSQGHWFRRWSAPQWLIVAAAASALRFAAMAAFGGTAWVLVAAQMLHAFTFAAHHAACVATVDRHFAGPLRGRGQALYTMLGYGLSGVAGGIAGGAISERFGFAALFGASAVVALGALACALRSRTLERLFVAS
jgi:PPP family 3-phenylpropionic acid transporter